MIPQLPKLKYRPLSEYKKTVLTNHKIIIFCIIRVSDEVKYFSHLAATLLQVQILISHSEKDNYYRPHSLIKKREINLNVGSGKFLLSLC